MHRVNSSCYAVDLDLSVRLQKMNSSGVSLRFQQEGQCAVKILQLDRQAALQELLVVLCQAVRLRDTRVDYLKISN